MTRRIRDEGEDVLRVEVLAVEFTCAVGHLWVLSREAILLDAAGAERCWICGGDAIDAALAVIDKVIERRGVVIELRSGSDDP